MVKLIDIFGLGCILFLELQPRRHLSEHRFQELPTTKYLPITRRRYHLRHAGNGKRCRICPRARLLCSFPANPDRVKAAFPRKTRTSTTIRVDLSGLARAVIVNVRRIWFNRQPVAMTSRSRAKNPCCPSPDVRPGEAILPFRIEYPSKAKISSCTNEIYSA